MNEIGMLFCFERKWNIADNFSYSDGLLSYRFSLAQFDVNIKFQNIRS